MAQGKCVVSIELPLPGGGFKTFRAGTIYDVSELDEATVKAYFEAPGISPPRGFLNRVEKPGEAEG